MGARQTNIICVFMLSCKSELMTTYRLMSLRLTLLLSWFDLILYSLLKDFDIFIGLYEISVL